MSQVPSLLKMQKSSSHPISPSCHPLLASLSPSPKPWAAALLCPLLCAALGVQSPGFVQSWDGDPGATFAPCSALTISSGCLSFTLQARISPQLSVPAAPRRAPGRWVGGGGGGKPSRWWDLGTTNRPTSPDPGRGEVWSPRTFEPPRGALNPGRKR